MPVVSVATRTSPGCSINDSSIFVVNSRIPDSVMTYCVKGAVCQSYVEPAAVSLNDVCPVVMKAPSLILPFVKWEFPSAPVYKSIALIMVGKGSN